MKFSSAPPNNFTCCTCVLSLFSVFLITYLLLMCISVPKVLVFSNPILKLKSFVATSLQHLRMAYSYHYSYVMPELVVTTQTFGIALELLQTGFWNTVMFSSSCLLYTTNKTIL